MSEPERKPTPPAMDLEDVWRVIDALDAALEERKRQMTAGGSAVEDTDLSVAVTRKRSKESAGEAG